MHSGRFFRNSLIHAWPPDTQKGNLTMPWWPSSDLRPGDNHTTTMQQSNCQLALECPVKFYHWINRCFPGQPSQQYWKKGNPRCALQYVSSRCTLAGRWEMSSITQRSASSCRVVSNSGEDIGARERAFCCKSCYLGMEQLNWSSCR